MIVSMMVLSTFSGKAMDKLPSAKPAPRLVEEMEARRKVAVVAADALLREKYVMCMQIFREESDEISQDSNSINRVESSLK